MKEVYIISAKRTPVGGLIGMLSNHSAIQLGAIAIKEAYSSVGIDPKIINSVYMGNVLSANIGQAPARQAAKFANIPNKVDCTTINKVCSSGLKATSIAAQQIQLGLDQVAIAGGMESMSNVPHYANLRKTIKLGNEQFIDGLLKDGLTDAFNNFHMGNAAELCVSKYKISREQQDDFALQSYEKAATASKDGKFKNEIIPISIKVKNEQILLDKDEDVSKVIPEKVPQLKPVFLEDGTITAANASNINDGAAAILLASQEAVEKYSLKPLAKIIAYADASQEPEWFTTSPSIAIRKALKQAGLSMHDIDCFEINEAYAAVVLANQKILEISSVKINKYGGAVAIGHPLGASGARILCTLISVLHQEGGKYGIAAICNGGGGSTAMIIENLNI
ncbi:MAG: acetyl-CoA C-acyltransferase [Flavobacterium sp.]|nr:MAG: acetyl-CoA C-acyltransferase [Flavobacterium sp.]